MFLAEALFALLIALALVVLMSLTLGVRGPWAAPWALFLVVFLFVWAGGTWVVPFGPTLFDVSWVPFLLVGLLLMLFVAAASHAPPRSRNEAVAQARAEEQAATIGLTVFFWVLIAALAAAVLAGYL